MVLSGAALGAYVIARKQIQERRREDGLAQLQARQGREGGQGDPLYGPSGEVMPVELDFEERLRWLEERAGRRRATLDEKGGRGE